MNITYVFTSKYLHLNWLQNVSISRAQYQYQYPSPSFLRPHTCVVSTSPLVSVACCVRCVLAVCL